MAPMGPGHAHQSCRESMSLMQLMSDGTSPRWSKVELTRRRRRGTKVRWTLIAQTDVGRRCFWECYSIDVLQVSIQSTIA